MSEPVHLASFPLGGRDLTYAVAGGTSTGDRRVMIDADDDLTAGTPWAGAGFVVAPFLDAGERQALRDGVTEMVADAVARHGGDRSPGFTLAGYHHAVDDVVHRAVVGDVCQGGLDVERLPVPVSAVEAAIGAICGVPVDTRCPGLSARVFCLRLVRPGVDGDHNPLHRDVWLDHLRHTVNAYVPLAGSTPRSSLALVPGSHRWPESDIERTVAGASIDGRRYDVPAVTAARRPVDLVRPDPGDGEVLVFSPYLIHGGGRNDEEATTRASLEMRFWRTGG